MILHTAELSPNQRATIETMVGRKLHDQENALLCGGRPKVASAEERQHAAVRMRYQLFLLDPSERRMSIEDCAAALLEKSEMPA
jgi:hypothetical protein